MNDNCRVVVATGMNLPSLRDPEGVFDYVIAGIVLLAVLFGVMLLLVGSL